MQYLEKDELRRLFAVAAKHDAKHHLALLVSLTHGLRASEVIRLRGTDIRDGRITVQRLKGSKKTVQPLRIDMSDPLFDESPLIELASQCGSERLFKWTRQLMDRFIKAYGSEAGLRADCCHHHVLKHSSAMLIWSASQQLGEVQNWLGHRSSSSSVAYLAVVDEMKAFRSLSAALA